MNINVENLVSISEANQNFSKVARLVDEKGTAIILKKMLLAMSCWIITFLAGKMLLEMMLMWT